MSDGQWVGLILVLSMVALAAWDMCHAPTRDDWESSGDERWRS